MPVVLIRSACQLLIRHLAWIALSIASGQASAIDLVRVYELALSSDPVYQGAGAANRASQELAPQAKARLLPNMNLSANTNGNILNVQERNSIALSTGTRKFNNQQYVLSVTQPIYRRDLWIQIGQADNRIEQADASYAFALQDLMLRAAKR